MLRHTAILVLSIASTSSVDVFAQASPACLMEPCPPNSPKRPAADPIVNERDPHRAVLTTPPESTRHALEEADPWQSEVLQRRAKAEALVREITFQRDQRRDLDEATLTREREQSSVREQMRRLEQQRQYLIEERASLDSVQFALDSTTLMSKSYAGLNLLAEAGRTFIEIQSPRAAPMIELMKHATELGFYGESSSLDLTKFADLVEEAALGTRGRLSAALAAAEASKKLRDGDVVGALRDIAGTLIDVGAGAEPTPGAYTWGSGVVQGVQLAERVEETAERFGAASQTAGDQSQRIANRRNAIDQGVADIDDKILELSRSMTGPMDGGAMRPAAPRSQALEVPTGPLP